MKTNREIFMDEINALGIEEFVKVVNAYGRCNRCSNSYWDGTQSLCHKNCNDSSCDMGQKEYFESYPDENLQAKYNKKYYNCNNSEHAALLQQFIDLLYVSGVVEIDNVEISGVKMNNLEICETCDKMKGSCYRCPLRSRNLRDIWERYLFQSETKITFESWLKNIVIPTISEEEICNKAKELYKLVYI